MVENGAIANAIYVADGFERFFLYLIPGVVKDVRCKPVVVFNYLRISLEDMYMITC